LTLLGRPKKERAMRTIAVVNQKGGCGKTITSINLSAFLALARRRVLLVDLDPQGHSTLGLSPGGPGAAPTMYDVLLAETRRPPTTIADIARPVGESFDLAPSDIRLSAAPEELAGVAGRENILARAFATLPSRYDYVIVDCPPNVGLLTFNALKACSEALIPMDPSFFSLHGMGKLFETFELLERETGHRLRARVLITLYSGRSPFVKAVVDEVHRHLAGQHFATVIRHSMKLAEAASHGQPISQYATHSAGYEDYQALAGEILQQEAAMAETGDAVRPDGVTPTIGEILKQETAKATAEAVPVATAPAVTPDGVTFTVEAPTAAHVHLAGDFNDWSLDDSEMEATGPVWKKTLKLAPGRYRYRYVIDGEWRSDPQNPAVAPSPFGGVDSVVELDAPQLAEEPLPQVGANGTA
jgi:chromosome partitioning protein